jgi:hypothetical protein
MTGRRCGSAGSLAVESFEIAAAQIVIGRC